MKRIGFLLFFTTLLVSGWNSGFAFSFLPEVVTPTSVRVGVIVPRVGSDGLIYFEEGYLYSPYNGSSIHYEKHWDSPKKYTLVSLGISNETFDAIEGQMLYATTPWNYGINYPSSSSYWALPYFFVTDLYTFADTLPGWIQGYKSAYMIYPTGYTPTGYIPTYGFDTPDTVAYQQIPLYRFARKDVHAHFFTAGEEEKDNVLDNLSASFEFQGVSHYVVGNYTLNAQPVYRMYNSLSGAHFYTASKDEVKNVLKNLDFFSLEGVAFFVFLSPEPETVPVYRFYASETASHFFTASEAEKNQIMSSVDESILKYEGVAWYAYPANN